MRLSRKQVSNELVPNRFICSICSIRFHFIKGWFENGSIIHVATYQFANFGRNFDRLRVLWLELLGIYSALEHARIIHYFANYRRCGLCAPDDNGVCIL